MITVVSWLWKTTGWRQGYTADHVNNFDRMLRKHTTIPVRHVCVTDMPYGVECETYPLWDEPHIETGDEPNCYKRLFLFSSEARQIFGPHVVSFDLDVIICDTIDDILQSPYDFQALMGNSAEYNGSLWKVSPGFNPYIWTLFDPDTSRLEVDRFTKTQHGTPYYGSDQAWISYMLPDKPKWTMEDGVYQWHCGYDFAIPPEDMRILFFAGAVKPWEEGGYYQELYERETQG